MNTHYQPFTFSCFSFLEYFLFQVRAWDFVSFFLAQPNSAQPSPAQPRCSHYAHYLQSLSCPSTSSHALTWLHNVSSKRSLLVRIDCQQS